MEVIHWEANTQKVSENNNNKILKFISFCITGMHPLAFNAQHLHQYEVTHLGQHVHSHSITCCSHKTNVQETAHNTDLNLQETSKTTAGVKTFLDCLKVLRCLHPLHRITAIETEHSTRTVSSAVHLHTVAAMWIQVSLARNVFT